MATQPMVAAAGELDPDEERCLELHHEHVCTNCWNLWLLAGFQIGFFFVALFLIFWWVRKARRREHKVTLMERELKPAERDAYYGAKDDMSKSLADYRAAAARARSIEDRYVKDYDTVYRSKGAKAVDKLFMNIGPDQGNVREKLQASPLNTTPPTSQQNFGLGKPPPHSMTGDGQTGYGQQ